jgi:hypothetical protein
MHLPCRSLKGTKYTQVVELQQPYYSSDIFWSVTPCSGQGGQWKIIDTSTEVHIYKCTLDNQDMHEYEHKHYLAYAGSTRSLFLPVLEWKSVTIF